MSSESPKLELYAQFSVVAKALGQAHRLALLELAAQGERSVDSLAESAGLSVANASQHLQQLRQAGLVVARRAGRQVLYRLTDDSVLDLIAALHLVAERNLAGVQRIKESYFHERDSLEPVTREDLVDRMRDGLVTVLDVRPAEEYAAGHVPGAINVRLDELERRLCELPRDQEIVAYCRGPYCVMSFEAVATLRARGYKVRRMLNGYPEWKAAGLPVEAV